MLEGGRMDSTPVLCVPSPPVAMVRVLTTGDQGTRSSVRVQSLVPREAAMWVEEPTLLGEQRERLELALLHDHFPGCLGLWCPAYQARVLAQAPSQGFICLVLFHSHSSPSGK